MAPVRTSAIRCFAVILLTGLLALGHDATRGGSGSAAGIAVARESAIEDPTGTRLSGDAGTAGGSAPAGSPPVGVRAPLGRFALLRGEIDYVAAGAAMRNQGYGNITVRWDGPLVAAYLVWGLMADTVPDYATLNGVPITGAAFADTPVNPCWTSTFHTLVANVTSLVVNGTNRLTGFPSGITTGEDPWSTPIDSLPLLEGASLVVIFEQAGPQREITLDLAANTVTDSNLLDTLPHGVALSPLAETTFIVADGQDLGNDAIWNAGVVEWNAFYGTAPRTSTQLWRLGNLWDTRTYIVNVARGSSMETAGISSMTGDCITWVGQVFRVDVGDRPPAAVAYVSPTVAPMWNTILFDASGSTDDFGIIARRWDFGDGVVGLREVATHAYASRGSFSVTLTVWDTANQTGTATVVVEIVNRRPVADAGPDQGAFKYEQVALDGNGSRDGDGDPLSYRWSQVAGPPVALSAPDSAAPTFTPSVVGSYAFLLTVDDGQNGTSQDDVLVQVWSRLPIGNIRATPSRVVVGNPVAFDASASVDPDGMIEDFTFAFGDGTTTSGPGDVRSHSFNAPGTYAVTLVVTDDDGNVSTALVYVTVIEAPTPPNPPNPPTPPTTPPSAPGATPENRKPLVAALLGALLAIAGGWSARRRPWRDERSRRAILLAFALSSLPFVVGEIATGVWSALTRQLMIPPLLGAGTIVDLAIFAIGMVVALLRSSHRTRSPGRSD